MVVNMIGITALHQLKLKLYQLVAKANHSTDPNSLGQTNRAIHLAILLWTIQQERSCIVETVIPDMLASPRYSFKLNDIIKIPMGTKKTR